MHSTQTFPYSKARVGVGGHLPLEKWDYTPLEKLGAQLGRELASSSLF